VDAANTVFVLLKFDMNGNGDNTEISHDKLSLWINPVLASGEGGLGFADAIWNGSDFVENPARNPASVITPTPEQLTVKPDDIVKLNFDSVNAFRLTANGTSGTAPDITGINGQFAIDELRVGTTFNDAFTGFVAVPEPSTFALVGLAGVVAFVGRRARRK
jgi:PEP-CTERM motif